MQNSEAIENMDYDKFSEQLSNFEPVLKKEKIKREQESFNLAARVVERYFRVI